ncbi:hypothetical protein FB45DRAFT_761394, partial [Roridomyces roridus]
LIFRWVFIPWLQTRKELDAYRNRVNNTLKRADRNKILPHGVPNDMFERPAEYGLLDFKVKVQPEAIDEVRDLYTPRNHEVFQLDPPDFNIIISGLYFELGQPAVTRQGCWEVYLQLRARFRALDEIYRAPVLLNERWGYTLTITVADKFTL